MYASKTGGATNIIAGLSVGMESCGLPVISIAIGIILSYYLGQNCGIKNAKTGIVIIFCTEKKICIFKNIVQRKFL